MEFWVENLVPNRIQTISLDLLESMACNLLSTHELCGIMLILIEA